MMPDQCPACGLVRTEAFPNLMAPVGSKAYTQAFRAASNCTECLNAAHRWLATRLKEESYEVYLRRLSPELQEAN